MGVLRDLWYGDLSHRDKLIDPGSEFENLIGQLADYEKEMSDELTGNQMELFQGYQEISEKLADLENGRRLKKALCWPCGSGPRSCKRRKRDIGDGP